MTRLPQQQSFPLETVSIFPGNIKISADMGDYVRFWAHRKLALESLHHLKILYNTEFDSVDWEMVYATLRNVA